MSNPGTRIVRETFEQFQVDPEWSAWDESGFTWWGHRHAQRIYSDEPFVDDGFTIVRINAETDFLRLPEIDRGMEAMLSVLGTHSAVSGLVRSDDEDVVRLRSSVYVHEEIVGWMSAVFQLIALLQLIGAEEGAEKAADVFGGEAAWSSHPTSGARLSRDDMLWYQKDFPPDSQTPVAVPQAEFEELGRALEARGIRTVVGESSLTSRIPSPAGAGALDDLVISVKKDARPSLGPGLSMVLQLPAWPMEPDGTQYFPLQLNEFEHDETIKAHFMGSWAVKPDKNAVPHFQSFLPSVICRSGSLGNLFLPMISRARWAAGLLAGRLPESMREQYEMFEGWIASQDPHELKQKVLDRIIREHKEQGLDE